MAAAGPIGARAGRQLPDPSATAGRGATFPRQWVQLLCSTLASAARAMRAAVVFESRPGRADPFPSLPHSRIERQQLFRGRIDSSGDLKLPRDDLEPLQGAQGVALSNARRSRAGGGDSVDGGGGARRTARTASAVSVRPRQPSTTSCSRWLGGGGRPLMAAQAQAPALLPPAADGRLEEAPLLQACGWATSTQGNFCWCVEGEKMPTSYSMGACLISRPQRAWPMSLAVASQSQPPTMQVSCLICFLI
jgi:hypothetical protein